MDENVAFRLPDGQERPVEFHVAVGHVGYLPPGSRDRPVGVDGALSPVGEEEVPIDVEDMVVEKHPLVVPQEADDVIMRRLQVEDEVHHPFRVGPAVDVVPDENEGVFPRIRVDQGDHLSQMAKAAVDVADGKNFSHTAFPQERG